MVSGLFTFLSSAARVLLWQATLPLENAYWYKSLMLGVRSGSDVSPWPWPWSLRPKSKSLALALALALGSKSLALALKVVLGLGRGLGQGQVLGLGQGQGQGPLSRLHRPAAIMLYTCVHYVHNSTASMTVTLLIYFMYPDGNLCPWILVWENSGCSCQRSPRWKSF